MRVLVTAASKHGATAEIADWIGTALRGAGAEVTLAEPETVESVSEFDAVVLGSGVYAGHWLAQAKDFALKYTGELTDSRVWIFSSGPIGDPLRPDDAPVDVAEMIPLTGAREHRLFGGRIDKHGMGFGERAILVALRVPEGDFRPRDDIAAWALGIATAVEAELGQTEIVANP